MDRLLNRLWKARYSLGSGRLSDQMFQIPYSYEDLVYDLTVLGVHRLQLT